MNHMCHGGFYLESILKGRPLLGCDLQRASALWEPRAFRCQGCLREHQPSLHTEQCLSLPYTTAAYQILVSYQNSTFISNHGEINECPCTFCSLNNLHLIKDPPNLYLNRRLIWQCNWKCFINYKVPYYVMTNVIAIINKPNIISNNKNNPS